LGFEGFWIGGLVDLLVKWFDGDSIEHGSDKFMDFLIGALDSVG
jgi:hypothetical protein